MANLRICTTVAGPLSLALMSLAACGGTGTPATTPPPTFDDTITAGDTLVSYDTKTGVVTLRSNPVSNPGDPELLPGITGNGPQSILVARGEGDYVYAIAAVSHIFDESLSGQTFGRVVPTTLPSGTANYSGDYLGIYSVLSAAPVAGAQSVRHLITGDVALAIDVGSRTLTGGITNRTIYDAAGTPRTDFTASDVTISTSPTVDPDGGFTALLEGGGLTQSGFLALGGTTTLDGRAQGGIAGPASQELGALVTINHVSAIAPGTDTNTYRERGVIIADRN